jgi:phosphohistidine phosphatase SixA
VGHEPVLGLLVSELCSGGAARVAMRKGAVAWLRGEPGSMALEGLLVPGMLRRD